MKDFPRVLRPGTVFTPFFAGELADVLSQSINVLGEWHLPVRAESRLRAAETNLRRIASRDDLGSNPAELKETAQSASLAADFYQIATSLSETPEDPIANELGIALGGTLEADSKDTSAYEIQSQFWVGMLLAQSGLRPAVPTGQGRLPDFVVRLNDLSCGVEVKRPREAKAVKRVVGDAAKQLEQYGRPGIIALDLSSAVGANSLVLPSSHRLPAREIINARLGEIADYLGTYIHRYARSNKYQHVIGLVAFARFWTWSSVAPPTSDAGIAFSMFVFPRAYSGILIPYANRLQEMLLRGIERVTGNPVSARRVS